LFNERQGSRLARVSTIIRRPVCRWYKSASRPAAGSQRPAPASSLRPGSRLNVVAMAGNAVVQ
jgi:hypothetical protein